MRERVERQQRPSSPTLRWRGQVPPAAAAVLALQATVGNAATTAALQVQRARGPDPTITSAAAAEWAPRGAYMWPAKMTIAAAQAEVSWIVQHIAVSSPSGNFAFWEAFPIWPGATSPPANDVYQDNAKKDAGKAAVVGRAQFHTTGGRAPAGMALGAVDEADSEQFTSRSKPPFWEDGGTPHDLSFKWWSDGAELTTDPDSGEPVRKNYYFELGKK